MEDLPSLNDTGRAVAGETTPILAGSWNSVEHKKTGLMAFARPPLKPRGNVQGNLAGKGKPKKGRSRIPPVDRHALLEDLRSISDNYASPECRIAVEESDLTSPTVRELALP